MLRHYVAEDQSCWDKYLPTLSCAYSRGVHRSAVVAPFCLVLARPPAPLGAENSNALPSIGSGLSKSSFLRQLLEKIAGANEQLQNIQQRYKRNFDRTVRNVNQTLTAGDAAFLDIRKTPAEENILGRRRNRLVFKTVGPYPVLANDGATIVLDIDSIAARINSDRVRRAPSRPDVLPSDNGSPDESETSSSAQIESGNSDGDGSENGI